MALLTIADISERTGVLPKHLYTYKKRGQLIETTTGSKKYDDNNSVNNLFIQKKLKGVREEKAKPEPNTKKESTKVTTQTNPLIEIEYQQKQLNFEIKQKELEMKTLDLKKKQGDLIGTAKAVEIASTYSSSLQKDIKSSIDTLIRDICTRHGLDFSYVSKYIKQTEALLNKSNDVAINKLIKQFENDR